MSQPRLPFAPAFDHLVYVRIFEGCNIHCEHCFIPSNPKRMSLQDVAGIPELLRGKIPAGSRILIQWHGGEPTLFGAKWLSDAIDSLEAAGPDYTWLHGIQTNLTTFDQSWADLYHRKFGSSVGVSWDHGIRLLRKRDPASNVDFEAQFWPKLASLNDAGLTPFLTVTGTGVFFDAFPNPIDLFEMMEARGVRQLHIERVTKTGYARDAWSRIGVSNQRWSSTMARFLRAYVRWHEAADGGRKLRISPFDGLIASGAKLARGEAGGSGCLSGNCDTTFHTIDSSGYKRGCTALTSESDNRRADTQEALRIADPAAEREVRQVYFCSSCEFRKICSSGCLALDVDDGSGECSGGKVLLGAARDQGARTSVDSRKVA